MAACIRYFASLCCVLPLAAAVAAPTLVPATPASAPATASVTPAPALIAGPAGHDLMPAPAEIAWSHGRLALDSTFTVALAGAKDARVQAAAQRFVARLAKRAGLSLNPAATAAPGKATLTLDCKKQGLPVQTVREDESYQLIVTDKAATLSAPNALGILRGLETLLQLVRSANTASFIPAVTVKDAPRFPWRGLLIDVGRHFHSLDVIKRNLDGLAEAKMNVFHWHLSEDQGFRVESKKYPKLHQLGSDGLFYTQEQIKDVIAYARARGIRVVPEFDVPGHATSWLVGYPELAAGPGPYAIERHFGIFNPTLDPTRDDVYAFLDGFIGEMAALFPDEYFHIGGDEVTGREWNSNASVQVYMNQHNFKTNLDLQAHFNQRLSKILTKHGKKMVGWDEIAHPNLPKNIVVQSWRGPEGLAAGARAGNDVILSNGYYIDLQWPAVAHYEVDPLPAGSDLDAKARAHILGGEACMWSEFVSSETIDSRIWPRLLAVAERLWSPAALQDARDMYRRLEIASARLDDHGLMHRANYLPMLERLVGKENVPVFKVLADVVSQVKGYRRGHLREVTSLMPLTRLVDAARPESDQARRFDWAVHDWLATAPKFGPDSAVRAPLETWKKSHAALGKVLEKSLTAGEAFPQSQDLSTAARVGLEALDLIKNGKGASKAWAEAARAAFNRAVIPRAEVDIAVLPGIRKLIVAAAKADTADLAPIPDKEW